MTLAEEYLKKVTEQFNYSLENYNELLNNQEELQEDLAWSSFGEDWEILLSKDKNDYERIRILKFKDLSYLKVIVNVVDGYASDFFLVKPHEETITTYREIEQ